MADKLRAFITAVTFADGSIHLNALAVPDEACAMVTTGVEAGRRFEGPSTGFAYAELSAEFLRSLLRAIDDRPAGEVVSLVPNTTQVTEGMTLAEKHPDPYVSATGDPNAALQMRSVGQAAREFLERQPQQWPLSKWPQPAGCLKHPEAVLLNGICTICRPIGGAA